MNNTILQKSLEDTAKKFMMDVFPDKGVCFMKAAEETFAGIILSGSTEIRELCSYSSCGQTMHKGVQERFSRRLENYDFSEGASLWMLTNNTPKVTAITTIAVDFSDISKEFGGKGMEGMQMGYDGSRHTTAMGHTFLGAVAVNETRDTVSPLHFSFTPGRKNNNEMLEDTVKQILLSTSGKGIIAIDRGGDSDRTISFLQSLGCTAVVRIKELKRDVFGNGLSIDKEFLNAQGVSTTLIKSNRRVNAQVCWKIGYFGALHTPILVVRSVIEETPLYLYMILKQEELENPDKVKKHALQAAQSYSDRWQIEVFFERIKQDFSLEKAKVRTFKRLKNLFYFCVLGYIYCTQILLQSCERAKILKVLKDNFCNISLKMQTLLSGIRTVLELPKIRYITGRPRKRKNDDRQLVLPI